MEALLKDEKLADGKVRVGYGVQQTVFPVVKNHLAKLSDFFRKRLYETDDKNFEVKLKFIPPPAFETILRKAYHLDIQLNGRNVIPTMMTCKRLKIDSLRKECEQYLKQSLDARNVLQIWDSAMKYKLCSKLKIDFRKPPKDHDQGLEDRILYIIAHESENVLHSEGFLDVSFEVIIRVVAAPFFRVKEEDLWQRVEEWMHAQAVPYLRRFRYKEKEQPYSSTDFDFPTDREAYESNLERIRPYYTDPDHKESDDEKNEKNEKKEKKEKNEKNEKNEKEDVTTTGKEDKGDKSDKEKIQKKKSEKNVELLKKKSEKNVEKNDKATEKGANEERKKKRREKPKLMVKSKDFEPTQKTIDELIDLWDNFFIRVFRYGLMKPAFFLDRVKDRIPDRDLREEVLIYFIDNKRRPRMTKIDPREMTEETGYTAGCRILKSNVEQENAKTLFDLTKGSRWSYRTCEQVPDQHFVAELPFFSYPQVIKLKNHFDDIDCVKELKLFVWKNPSVNYSHAKEADEEKGWVECYSFVSQQTKEWQEFKTNLTAQHTSRWFKVQVMSTYGRYSCIESIQFGIACKYAQVIMREEPPKQKPAS